MIERAKILSATDPALVAELHRIEISSEETDTPNEWLKKAVGDIKGRSQRPKS